MQTLIRSSYGEIVKKDCYKLNDWPNNYFDTIIDIGANVGVFVLYAHMRHPRATLLAYEPCKDTFEELTKNTWWLNNVKRFNIALGNGQPLFFRDVGYSPCSMFFEENTENSYSVPSCTLSQIFKENEIGDKYCVKIDCEGGERFLLDDSESLKHLQEAHLFSLEVHFPPQRQGVCYERFKTLPKWAVWDDWIYDNFKETHNILYHMSDGKSRGAGIYVLTKL